MNIFVFRFLKMSGSFYFNLFSDRETRIKIHYLWDAHAFYFLSQFVCCCCCCFSSRSKNREENKKKYSTVPVQFCSYEWHRVVSVSSFCIFNVLSTFAYQVFFPLFVSRNNNNNNNSNNGNTLKSTKVIDNNDA